MIDSETSLRLRAEQTRQLCRVLPISVGMSVSLAFVAAAILWRGIPTSALLAWLAPFLLVNLGRLYTYREFSKLQDGDHHGTMRLARQVRFGSLAAGVSWGLTVPLVFHPSDLVLQLFLAFVLAGITAGAATSMAADKQAALSFNLPVLLPLTARLTAVGDTTHVAMAAMVLLYTTFLVVSAYRSSAQHLENIVLRLKAQQREQQLYESESRFRRLAHHDTLTGLPNRFSLQHLLPPLLNAAAVNGGRLALLYLDLDNFKDINDSRGHGCGDQVLTTVAQRLLSCVRAEDVVVRMGGDEFIVVTPVAASRNHVEQLAARIRGSLSAPLQTEGEPINICASIGIGVFPDDGADTESLMKHADIALYQAKANGRNSYEFYAATMSTAVAERLQMEHALFQALKAEQIFVEYQPVVSLPSGAVTGLEALARWQHPDLGMVPPATFIAIAERCGQIDRLGELVLRKVGQQLRAWQADNVPMVPIAVNVSSKQFERSSIAQLVSTVTSELGIDPSLLQVEITESMLMSHGQENFATLEALRLLGTRVAIDDFGTGYSSLGYLKHLPIDAVKIDRCFVRDMQSDHRDEAIVSAIVNIAHSLGLRVVAEGVETAHQAEQLSALGCDAAQGYYYFKPLGAEQCRELLVHQSRHGTSDTLRMRILRWMQSEPAAHRA